MQQIITNNSIRLFLQDRPNFNSLLDGCRWSEEMLNEAVLNCVDYFNYAQPPLTNAFSVETFPYRWLLLTGVAGYLLRSAAINETSNSLQYSADGVEIDDKNHGPAFFEMGTKLWDEFKEMTQNIRTNTNMAACYGRVSSEWAYRAFNA